MLYHTTFISGVKRRRISAYDIERARSIPSLEVVEALGLSVKGQGAKPMLQCPFHHDKTPSAQVYADGVFCYAGCGQFDNIKLVQHYTQQDFRRSMKWLAEIGGFSLEYEVQDLSPGAQFQRRVQRERHLEELRRQRNLREELALAEKAKERLLWPDLVKGSRHQCQALARLRGIGLPAIELANESGFLRFGDYCGQKVWALVSETDAQVRRLDGRPFTLGGSSPKSRTLKGSLGMPIGFVAGSGKPIWIAEGEPDWLAVWHLARFAACADEVMPVSVSGAGKSLCRQWRLDGREVRIFAQTDEPGRRAAVRWRREAFELGAGNVTVHYPSRGTDWNEFVQMGGASW